MDICKIHKGLYSKPMEIHIEMAMPNDVEIQESIYKEDAYSLYWALKSLPVGTYERLMKYFMTDKRLKMAKIKTPPVFEKIDGTWQLMGLDCPLCPDGTLEVLKDVEYQDVNDIENIDLDECHCDKEYAACNDCHCVVSWYPYRLQAQWRVLQ